METPSPRIYRASRPFGGDWVLHVASLRRLLRWLDRRALRFRHPLGLEGSLGLFFGRSLRLEPSLGLSFSLSGGFEGSLGLCFGRRTSLTLKGHSLLLYLLQQTLRLLPFLLQACQLGRNEIGLRVSHYWRHGIGVLRCFLREYSPRRWR